MDVYRGILSHGPFVDDEALTVIVAGGLKTGSHVTAWWKWTQKPTEASGGELVVYQGLIDEEVTAHRENAERLFEHKGTYNISFFVHDKSLSVILRDSQGNLGSFPKTVLDHAYSFPTDVALSLPSLFVGLTPKLPHFNESYLIAALVAEDLKLGTPAVVLWHENHAKEIPAADRLVKYELEIADVDESHTFQEVATGPHLHLKGGNDAFNAIVHADDRSLKFRIASADSDLPEDAKWATLRRYPLAA